MGGTVGVRFVGHATTVLDLGGVRIATDPLLRTRLGPLERHGPTPDAAWFEGIDAVLVSHGHPDHFDPRSLAAVSDAATVIVPRGLGQRAAQHVAGPVLEVAAGDRIGLGSLEVEVVPARHWITPGAPRAQPVGYLRPSVRRPRGLLCRRHGTVPGARRPGRSCGSRAAAGLDVGAAPRPRAPRAAFGRRAPRAAGRVGRGPDPLGHALSASPVARLGPAAPPAGDALRGPRRRRGAGRRCARAPTGRPRHDHRSRIVPDRPSTRSGGTLEP